MGYSASPRNTAVASNTGTAISLTVTLSPTSTVAGDLGVVAISYRRTTGATNTWSPPSGWTLIRDVAIATDAHGLAIFYNPSLPGGVTSLAFQLSVSAGEVPCLNAAYGCWAGLNNPGTPFEGTNSTSGTSSATPLASVATGTENFANDLCIWAAFNAAFSVTNVLGNPTGTGTWTAVAHNNSPNQPNGNPSIWMASQVGGAPGTTQTASGATNGNTGSPFGIVMVAFVSSASGGFFALVE